MTCQGRQAGLMTTAAMKAGLVRIPDPSATVVSRHKWSRQPLCPIDLLLGGKVWVSVPRG